MVHLKFESGNTCKLEGRTADIALSFDSRWMLLSSGSVIKVWDLESKEVSNEINSESGDFTT